MSETQNVRPRLMIVYGTRPEAIKLAPVIRMLYRHGEFCLSTVITAQHREMLDQVNELFGIHPDVDLDLMQRNQSLNLIASSVMRQLDKQILSMQPDAVIVQGDTTTVMSTAIAAFNRNVDVVHVEAGLRSGNLRSPFPEEANRKLVSQIASLHIAPTAEAKNNLIGEGVSERDIFVTGNTVIDALTWSVDQVETFTNQALASLDSDAPIVLLTVHRRENLGSRMVDIAQAVRELAYQFPHVNFVWPAHKNPGVRATMSPLLSGLVNVIQVEPLNYDEFALLIARSKVVLTDSGGLQEEAPSLGKPVLVLRENTERPEAVVAGTVKLIGTHAARIIDEVSRLLSDESAHQQMARAVNPYGDGHAAERVLAVLRHRFADGERPHDFVPAEARTLSASAE